MLNIENLLTMKPKNIAQYKRTVHLSSVSLDEAMVCDQLQVVQGNREKIIEIVLLVH